MRNDHPDRVRALDVLRAYLAKYPDARIGQTIVNMARLVGENLHPFYIEDGELALMLERYLQAPRKDGDGT